ncbi:MAG TPA: hypothetical protein VGL82_00260 [Bryobacteraceae bacterium]|jgi:hypothetical protein
MPVDHEQAIEKHLAECYVLNEMSGAEAESFEQHFFECIECASAVDAGQMLLATGREVAGEARQPVPPEESPRSQRVSFRVSLAALWGRPAGFVPVAAALVLAVLAIYQNAVVIPGLREAGDSARVIPAFQLIAASRGDAPSISVAPGASSFAVSMDVPPDAQYSRYICELTSAGKIVFDLTSAAPAAGQPVTILVPARDLRPGVFELTISGVGADGQKREKVSVFPFNLQFNQH